jgi:hypothetical protein
MGKMPASLHLPRWLSSGEQSLVRDLPDLVLFLTSTGLRIGAHSVSSGPTWTLACRAGSGARGRSGPRRKAGLNRRRCTPGRCGCASCSRPDSWFRRPPDGPDHDRGGIRAIRPTLGPAVGRLTDHPATRASTSSATCRTVRPSMSTTRSDTSSAASRSANRAARSPYARRPSMVS